MGKKKDTVKQTAKTQSMIDNSNDSRNSTHGYMETGNSADTQAKGRAVRSNSNR